MKKLILLVMLAAGMSVVSKGQESGFGIRAGLNLSNLRGDFKDAVDGSDVKMKAGFHVGVIYDWGISESFYIQPGLYYNMKGVKAEDKEESSYKSTYNLSYLEVPVLASYRIALSDRAKWQINAGPYFAVGVGGKLKYEGDGEEEKMDAFGKTEYNEDGEGEDKGDLKRFDFGLSFGIGVSINQFYVGLKYDLGLSNIGEKDRWYKGEEESKAKIRTGNFAISVGYNF